MANEKRPIDANAIKYTLKAEPGGWGGEPYEIAAKHDIDKMPTVDAVIVVRCKDCKHGSEDHEDAYLCDNPYCGLMGFTRGDDFCSYGERREGE